MTNANTNLERKTLIEEWSKLLGEPISEEEYLAIGRTLWNFFEILDKWDKASKVSQEH